jgi:hypothetical protein
MRLIVKTGMTCPAIRTIGRAWARSSARRKTKLSRSMRSEIRPQPIGVSEYQLSESLSADAKGELASIRTQKQAGSETDICRRALTPSPFEFAKTTGTEFGIPKCAFGSRSSENHFDNGYEIGLRGAAVTVTRPLSVLDQYDACATGA